jgi:hypothetical protein
MPAPMSMAETITTTVASLFFKSIVFSPSCVLFVKATARTRRDHGLSRLPVAGGLLHLHQALREPGSVIANVFG